MFRKQTQASLEARTVLETGEYSENKTSIDILITIQLLFFPSVILLVPVVALKICPQILWFSFL